MRKILPVLLIVIVASVLVWLLRPRKPALEQVCIAERRVTAWSRLAQVREPVASLKYGERVSVLERKPSDRAGVDNVRVRTPSGAEGWIESRQIMSTELAARAMALVGKARTMPVQAWGKTRVLTNVRLAPGRESARIFQFPSDVEVEVFARAVAERPVTEEPGAATPPTPLVGDVDKTQPRREDWLLIRGRDEEAGEIAGWIRGSFIEPSVPQAIHAYGQGFRFVAWFELSRVVDVPPPPPGKAPSKAPAKEDEPAQAMPPAFIQPVEKPQYLVAGLTGGEGGPCDFTLIRFYTWSSARRGYETAYVESLFCGKFPILVTPIPPGGDPRKAEAAFSFTATGTKGEELREYRVRQTVVRRLHKKP
jgi:hypothetical protein